MNHGFPHDPLPGAQRPAAVTDTIRPQSGNGAPTLGRSPPRPRGSRLLFHLTFFLLTALTLSVAGGFWTEFRSIADFGDPARMLAYLRAGWPYAALVLLILGAHEAGHYFACRYYGIAATLPLFIPGVPPVGTFGAVIRIRSPIPNRKALFDVAAAGPIAGFVIAFPLLFYGLARAQPFDGPTEGGGGLGPPLGHVAFGRFFAEGTLSVDHVYLAAWVGLLMTSLNLFPVGQLDGGHAAYAIGRRLHRGLARATLFGLLVLMVTQVVLGRFPPYLLWFAILAVMRDRHPRLLDEHSPLGRTRIVIGIVLLVIFALSFIPIPIVT